MKILSIDFDFDVPQHQVTIVRSQTIDSWEPWERVYPKCRDATKPVRPPPRQGPYTKLENVSQNSRTHQRKNITSQSKLL